MEIKEIIGEFWDKGVKLLLLFSVGFFSLAGDILRELFNKGKK